jgi:hypothetical protein
MFCPHKPAVPTGNKEEMAGLSCWQLFKNLGKMAIKLSNQVSAFSAAMSLLSFSEPGHVEYRDGQLFLDDQPQALRGPETPGEAFQVWGDIAREFAQDAELLAERIDE